MERVSPAELRKSLIMVDAFKKTGLGFIPVPYKDEAERIELLKLSDVNLQCIIDKCEE